MGFKVCAKRKLSQDIILWGLLLYAGTYFIYQDFNIPLTVGFLGMTAIILLNAINQKSLKTNLVGIALLILNVVILMQYIRPDANINIDTIMYLLAMFMFSLAALVANPKKEDISSALKGMKTLAFIFTSYVLFFTVFRQLFIDVIYPILAKPSQEYFDRFLPRGFNPCLGASYTYTDYVIILGIASVCADFFNKTIDKVSNKKNTFLLVYYCLGIFLVQRRGELVALCVSIWLLWIIVSTLKKQVTIAITTIGGISAVIGLVVHYFPIIRHWDAISRYVRTIELWIAGQDISSGRGVLYSLAHEMFVSHPMFGIGWKRFADNVPTAFKMVHGEKVMDVHNNYLQFLCETGIVGFIFIMIPLLMLLCIPIRDLAFLAKLQRRRSDDDLCGAIQASIVAVIIQLFFFVVGIFDPNFYKSYFWCFYSLAIVFSIYAHRLKCNIKSRF